VDADTRGLANRNGSVVTDPNRRQWSEKLIIRRIHPRLTIEEISDIAPPDC